MIIILRTNQCSILRYQLWLCLREQWEYVRQKKWIGHINLLQIIFPIVFDTQKERQSSLVMVLPIKPVLQYHMEKAKTPSLGLNLLYSDGANFWKRICHAFIYQTSITFPWHLCLIGFYLIFICFVLFNSAAAKM